MRSPMHTRSSTAHRKAFPYIRVLTAMILLQLTLLQHIVYAEEGKYYTEKIFLHTDRDYYISGEDIAFRAYLSTGNAHEVKSRILYVELGGKKNYPGNELAFWIEDNAVSGTITIPDSLRSGVYVLSAYTNWHKNFAYRFAYRKELIIINRFGNSDPVRVVNPDRVVDPDRVRITDSLAAYYVSVPGRGMDHLFDYQCNIYKQGRKIRSERIQSSTISYPLFKLDKATLPPGLLKLEVVCGDDPVGSLFIQHSTDQVSLSVVPDREIYSTRSPVGLSLRLEGKDIDIEGSDLSLSVVAMPDAYPMQRSASITDWFEVYSELSGSGGPETGSRQKRLYEYHSPASWIFDELDQSPQYPIETEGRIISGKVIERKTNIAVPGALIFFSFIDTLPYLDYDRTDSLGNFYFSLPYGLHCDPGILQIWELPEGKSDCMIIFEEAEMLPPPNQQSLDELRGNALTEIFARQVKAFEITSLFAGAKDRTQLPAVKPSDYRFESMYKGFCHTVYPKDYIRLNNFSEIAREILPGVRLRNEQEGISIRILDEFRNEYFDSRPLVMVNGLPMKNLNNLANLSSDDIERIDIVRGLFAAGTLIFPGVLSIKLKSDIRSDLLTGQTLYPVKSEIIRQSVSPGYPQYKTEQEKLSRRPDLRNTLYWLPDLPIPNGEAQVSFYTGDLPGRYRISVEGMVNDSIPVSAERDIFIQTPY